MTNKPEELDIFSATGALGDILLNEVNLPVDIKSFDDFVQDIYSLSFPGCNFNTWHVRLMCHKIDELIKSSRTEKYLLGVLPRYHLKSTVLGYATSIYRMLTSYGDGLYVSYKDELALYHSGKIKQYTLGNPVLSRFMKDCNPQSDTAANFKIGNNKHQLITSGIFSMKRGLHTDMITVCDDILGDLNNPMALNELEKVSRIFDTELINIPNKNCPLIVYGTVIDPSDILFKLANDPQFEKIWLPAINPDPEHEVLWEAQYPRDWLERRKQSGGWKAFSSEFLLMPVMATEAFFMREDLDKVINKNLRNYSLYQTYPHKGGNYVVAGLDIGKRRNPSHFAVFASDENDNLKMIHQSFWDGLDYIEQVERIKSAIDNFNIDKMYIDCTRSEMEDRGLPRQCIMIKFNARGVRNQGSFANDFAKRVESKTIELIDDDRFISQILALTNDLKAVETPAGHADSFWSVALAIGAYQDYYAQNRKTGFAYLGNMQETLVPDEKKINKKDNICKICNKRTLKALDNGDIFCETCFTIFPK